MPGLRAGGPATAWDLGRDQPGGSGSVTRETRPGPARFDGRRNGELGAVHIQKGTTMAIILRRPPARPHPGRARLRSTRAVVDRSDRARSCGCWASSSPERPAVAPGDAGIAGSRALFPCYPPLDAGATLVGIPPPGRRPDQVMAGLPAAHRRRPARPRRRGASKRTERPARRAPRRPTGSSQSVCPYCAVGCGQQRVRQGRQVTQIEGDPDSPISRGRLCPKGGGEPPAGHRARSREHEVLYRAPVRHRVGASSTSTRRWT